jgi:hypothetical protein
MMMFAAEQKKIFDGVCGCVDRAAGGSTHE